MDVVLSWLYEVYCRVPSWLTVSSIFFFGLFLGFLIMRYIEKELARFKIIRALRTHPDSSPTEIAKATSLSEDEVADVLEDLEIEGWVNEDVEKEKESARALIKLVLKNWPGLSVEEVAEATGLSIEVVEDLMDDDHLYESLKMKRSSGD